MLERHLSGGGRNTAASSLRQRPGMSLNEKSDSVKHSRILLSKAVAFHNCYQAKSEATPCQASLSLQLCHACGCYYQHTRVAPSKHSTQALPVLDSCWKAEANLKCCMLFRYSLVCCNDTVLDDKFDADGQPTVAECCAFLAGALPSATPPRWSFGGRLPELHADMGLPIGGLCSSRGPLPAAAMLVLAWWAWLLRQRCPGLSGNAAQ